MIGLDTNVLVRYLTHDDPAQARRAEAVMNGLVAGRERAAIAPVVLCELVWVLRDAYDTSKKEIVEVLDRILGTQQFAVVDRDRVREALDAYRRGRGDFADYLTGATHAGAGCETTVTFDRDLRDATGFRLL
jgi:predicted nucleic-acid-binding protein